MIQHCSLSYFKGTVSSFLEKVIFGEIPLQEGLTHRGKIFFCATGTLAGGEKLAGQTLAVF